MKVYIITQGEYSDYHICAVAEDKDKAERLRKLYSTYCDEAEVEEFDTEDTNYPNVSNEPRLYWRIYLKRHGKFYPNSRLCIANMWTTDENLGTHGDFDYDYRYNQDLRKSEAVVNIDRYIAEVFVEDKDKAIKVAQDMYAKALAEYYDL